MDSTWWWTCLGMRLGERDEGNLLGSCLSSGRVLSILEAGNTARGLDGGWKRVLGVPS